METADLMVVSIVWLLIVLTSVKGIVESCRKKVIKDVLGKGVRLNNPSTQRFKYILEPIFSYPSPEYSFDGTQIQLEVISQKNSRMATLYITEESVRITRNICCIGDIRAYFRVIRKTAFASIAKVRVVHNCEAKDAKIFLEGIESYDLKNGERRFYSVQEFIINEDKELALVYNVKEHEPTFFSKQVLTPCFLPLDIEDFGRPLNSIRFSENSIEESNGVIIRAKLVFYEVFVFTALFVELTSFITVSILVYFGDISDTNSTTVAAILLSGFFSLSITESLAIIYRDYIKYYYNRKCSPMRIESGTSSKTWSFIRYFYLFLVFVSTFLLSITVPVMISSRTQKSTLAEDYSFDVIKNRANNEILFLLLFLTASLLVTVIVWFVFFGVLRYMYRSLVKYPKITAIVDIESAKDDYNLQPNKKSFSETSDKTKNYKELKYKSNVEQSLRNEISGFEKRNRIDNQSADKKANDSRKEKKVGRTDSQTSTLSSIMSSSDSSKSKKNKSKTEKYEKLELGTNLLEEELADREKQNRLLTNSVIHEPTNSVGFINPEYFRLSNSQIDTRIGSKVKSDVKKQQK